MPQPQQLRIQAMSSTYTPAQGTTRSLTHWLRLGNEPASSCILVGFIIPEPQQELSGSFIVHKLHLNKITQREKGRKGGRKEGNCAQLCFGQDSLCVKYSLITKIKKKFSIDIELCQMSFTLCGGGAHPRHIEVEYGRIGDAAARLHHSHSNVKSELHLGATPQLRTTWDP